MRRDGTVVEHSYSNILFVAAIVVAALYVGREVLLPIALAVLLSFLLSPLVEWLERWKCGRITAVLSVVSAAFMGVAVLAVVLANQVYDLAYQLPDYKGNILAKVQAFQGDGSGVIGRATKAVEEMRAKLSTRPGQLPESSVPEAGPEENPFAGEVDEKLEGTLAAEGRLPEKPIPVEVVETLSAQEIARGILGPLIAPLSSAAMVTVFVIFMLLKREDLRNRFIHLIGGQRLNLTTQALDDAASRISRYLLMQAIINAAYGMVICVGLLLIGLPNAILWGVLTAVLRFIPYLGPVIAALMPIAISLAVFEGWSQPALVLGLFVANELVSNNIIEPWLYGSSTGISTIGILASAVFWTWIWGPVGLVMATPLTVCLSVIGRYVPQLAFFNTMLSEEDVVPAHSRLYQRLLAMDPEEATEVAEDCLAESSLAELYSTVLIPALSLAEQDRHHGDLDDVKQRFIYQTMREIVEDLGERVVKVTDEMAKGTGTVAPDADRFAEMAPIFCLPARDEADEIAGLMLCRLLELRGIAARVASTGMLHGEMIEQVKAESFSVVCVSALPPFAATHARYLCKRLRPRCPELKIVVGVWQTTAAAKKTQERLAEIGVDKVVTTLGDAADELERLARNVLVQQLAEVTDRAG